jgi:cytochrome c-type biogenesis protein CcmH/NrfF
MLPLAHVGHWLWVLYVLPVLIVVFSIVRTTLSERREARDEDASSSATDA